MAKPAEIVFASLLAAFVPACVADQGSEDPDIAVTTAENGKVTIGPVDHSADLQFTLTDASHMRQLKCLDKSVFRWIELDSRLDEIVADGAKFRFADCGLDLGEPIDLVPARWAAGIDRVKGL